MSQSNGHTRDVPTEVVWVRTTRAGARRTVTRSEGRRLQVAPPGRLSPGLPAPGYLAAGITLFSMSAVSS